ncbi:hypothetical protein VP01_3151g2 [Puccinia sorghi]|uniref:Uncharacterized protein n=1 Tax=Puccinia sorghi TaxID=27349 RepID=A0A0L6UYW5_9BASI|nr:hypothetical protein VP01_3151g2 [Puccinia sorghi]
MKLGRRLGFLLLWVESLKAAAPENLLSETISAPIEASKTESIFKPSNQAEILRFPPTSTKEEGENAWRSQQSTPFLKGVETKESNTPRLMEQPVKFSRENPTADPAGEYCTRALHAKRRLILVRRGCFGVTGSALLATSRGLARAGAALKRFDKLTTRQKLGWFGRKAKNGLRYAAIGVAAAVALPVSVAVATVGVAVAVPTVVVGYLSWTTFQLLRRVALHTWKYFGKGLAATGRGLKKAGDRMQQQSAVRLSKKVPPTTPQPTPGRRTGPPRQ